MSKLKKCEITGMFASAWNESREVRDAIRVVHDHIWHRDRKGERQWWVDFNRLTQQEAL